MNRLLVTICVCALQIGIAAAAGPFDGQLKGGSAAGGRTSGAGRCPATNATITIANGKMTNTYTAGAYTFHVNAAVANDGTVTGTWSVNPFRGKITGTHFAGSYDSAECGTAREVTLDKVQ